MRLSRPVLWTVLTGTVSIVSAAAALAAGAPAAAVASGTPASARSAPAAPGAARPNAVPVPARGEAPGTLLLARAAFAWRAGDMHGVVDALEPIDFALEPGFDGADRAAFLLAQACLALGELDRFEQVAAAVATWRGDTPFTRWIAYQRVLAAPAGTDAGGAPGTASGAAVAAARQLAGGEARAALERLAAARGDGVGAALSLYVKSLAQSAAGEDDTATLETLAGADTTTALGRELAGLALLRLATRAEAAGRDPSALLARVPVASPWTSRALHMRGLWALEHGDSLAGRAWVTRAAADTAYADRDAARLALAGLDLDARDWSRAYDRYAAIAADAAARRTALMALRDSGDFAPLWQAWRAHGGTAAALALDGDAVDHAARALAGRATRLDETSASAPPALQRESGAAAGVSLAPPPAAAWERVGAAARALERARGAVERTDHALAGERARLARQRDYFAGGRTQLDAEIAALYARSAALDSLRATLDQLDARIRGVRDAATQRVLRRAAEIVESGAAHLAWLGALRHFHLEGVPHAGEALAPDGYPSADSLVAAETALTKAIVAAARGIAAAAPDLITRSYAEAWRPRLIDRTAAEADRAHATLARARGIAAAVDSNLAAAAGSARLDQLARRAADRAAAREARAATYRAVSDSAAGVAIARALAALDARAESVDYGLAVAAYGQSVGLDLAAADAPEDSTTVAWRARAIAAMRTFLTRHPDSFARGEMRFRLADALLVDARETFRAQMAEFVRRQKEGGAPGALPVMDHRPAFELYAAILAEDPGFEHRDAVLFNSGMLLADDGNDDAGRYFGELVRLHPDSPYCQEAWLRMGDLAFNDRDHAAAAKHYAHAAEGPDPNLTAMALYKLGWAESNQDRFLEAADAFRTALDLYASPARARITADVEGESESWLVQSLARAGGADAFARYFDRIGGRPYDMRILMELAAHFRRYSLFEEAAAADAMCIERYPLHPEALTAAERLPDTWMKADRAAEARAAQLDGAAHFAPGSAWAKAQESDSVRALGAAFARGAWTSVALWHHAEARRTGAAAEWRQALALYGTLIRTWPADPETPLYHLYAGEAGARLGEPALALEHYRAAADAGADSIAERALHERVAVTDAWYERTRKAAGTGHTGSDSLAHAVQQAADELLERFPAHAGGADIRWREANLALAHGWYERAAADFGRMSDTWPADPRAPAAAGLRADALFRIARFDAAGDAYEAARLVAERAGADSIAAHAGEAVPVARFRFAESVAHDDSSNFRRQAELFEQVAARYPDYEHAHLAQYRAGLAWLAAGDRERGTSAMETLIARFPKSEFVKDAHLQIAATWEQAGEKRRAADAYQRFAQHYPEDPGAADAWLKSADLYEAAGLAPRAEQIRLAYLERYPDDHEAAMEILEPLARRDLEGVDAAHPVSALLGRPAQGAAPSALARYMRRASAHPELASRELVAEVMFQQGEESRAVYEGIRLTQPLERSIRARQVKLDSLVARYRRAIDVGVPAVAHAGAYRIGEALIGFGTALEQSERPADISGDDRLAYEDVLVEKAQAFYDRGEQVWEELLRQNGADAGADRWVAEARGALWKRLGQRFYFRPEVEFPLVEGKAPVARAATDTSHAASGAGRTAAAVTRQEDPSR